jgi:hypothetical protein
VHDLSLPENVEITSGKPNMHFFPTDFFAFGLSATLKPKALELLFPPHLIFLLIFAFGRQQSCLPQALKALFDPPTGLY